MTSQALKFLKVIKVFECWEDNFLGPKSLFMYFQHFNPIEIVFSDENFNSEISSDSTVKPLYDHFYFR